MTAVRRTYDFEVAVACDPVAWTDLALDMRLEMARSRASSRKIPMPREILRQSSGCLSKPMRSSDVPPDRPRRA